MSVQPQPDMQRDLSLALQQVGQNSPTYFNPRLSEYPNVMPYTEKGTPLIPVQYVPAGIHREFSDGHKTLAKHLLVITGERVYDPKHIFDAAHSGLDRKTRNYSVMPLMSSSQEDHASYREIFEHRPETTMLHDRNAYLLITRNDSNVLHGLHGYRLHRELSAKRTGYADPDQGKVVVVANLPIAINLLRYLPEATSVYVPRPADAMQGTTGYRILPENHARPSGNGHHAMPSIPSNASFTHVLSNDSFVTQINELSDLLRGK